MVVTVQVICIALYVIQMRPTWTIGEDVLARGASEAGRSTLVVCGLARNISHRIGAKRAEIEAIGAYFEDYRVLIVTNNNSDDTLDQLNEWARQNRRVQVIVPADDVVLEGVKRPIVGGAAHDRRIVRMAGLREEYLERVRARYAGATYMLVVDLDLDGAANVGGLLASLARDGWSAVFVNGMVTWFGGAVQLPYDTLAYASCDRADGVRASMRWRAWELAWWSLWGCRGWHRVESAFGGYGLYRVCEVVKEGVSYVSEGGAECEHHTFHARLRGAKYINPAWAGRFRSH